MLLAYSDKDVTKSASGKTETLYKKGEIVGFSFEDVSPYILLEGYNTEADKESDQIAPCIYIDDKLWEAIASSSIKYQIKSNLVDTGLTDYKYPVADNKVPTRLSVKDNYVPISITLTDNKTHNPNDEFFEAAAVEVPAVTLTVNEQLLARAILQVIGNDDCKTGAISKTPDIIDVLKKMKQLEILDETCITAAQTANFISQDEANAIKAVK